MYKSNVSIVFSQNLMNIFTPSNCPVVGVPTPAIHIPLLILFTYIWYWTILPNSVSSELAERLKPQHLISNSSEGASSKYQLSFSALIGSHHEDELVLSSCFVQEAYLATEMESVSVVRLGNVERSLRI